MSEKQSMAARVLRIERRRQEAASLLRRITPTEGAAYEIPGLLHRSTVARARQGDMCNWILRPAILLEALQQAGGSRQDAEAVLAFIAVVIEELWPSSNIDWDTAMVREQAADGEEDWAQVVALTDRTRRALWREAATLHVAAQMAAIAAVARDEEQFRRAA